MGFFLHLRIYIAFNEYVNLNFILKMSLTTNDPLFGVSFRDFFLANLAKGKMSICHHFSSVVCRPLTFHIR
jgi:hypothetical protein